MKQLICKHGRSPPHYQHLKLLKNITLLSLWQVVRIISSRKEAGCIHKDGGCN